MQIKKQIEIKFLNKTLFTKQYSNKMLIFTKGNSHGFHSSLNIQKIILMIELNNSLTSLYLF